jgi:hypothetical protein
MSVPFFIFCIPVSRIEIRGLLMERIDLRAKDYYAKRRIQQQKT